jgi:ADP-heptose:LPS heptosyltransferase
MYKKRKLLLTQYQSPGDVVMLTAAVRDLHAAYPGRFLTDVDTAAMEIWENNPHVTRLPWFKVPRRGRQYTVAEDPDVEIVNCVYGNQINEGNHTPHHFVSAFHRSLGEHLKMTIPVGAFKGDIHLNESEKNETNPLEKEYGYDGDFWIMVAGGKFDFTTKWWAPENYQAVIDHFKGKIQFVQCGDTHHWHPPMKDAFNMLGKTPGRDFIKLMHHAAGVVCPITYAMTLAAAVPTWHGDTRPCVVIAGGREGPAWNAYPTHQYLHTVGTMDCCPNGGCWRGRVTPVGDGSPSDQPQYLCKYPTDTKVNGLKIAKCMMSIEPRHVIEAIERYTSNGRRL